MTPSGEMEERVVLVDETDHEVGTAPKLSAHVEGKLHRAVSVFVFNSEGNTLLQRRTATKYHSAGLWSNTCCGHPRPGESTAEAAHRRLREEMGFDCPLHRLFDFVYKTQLSNDLVEHECDHVFVGCFDGTPEPNQQEVEDWRWVAVDQVMVDQAANPKRYTAWFRIALDGIQARGLP